MTALFIILGILVLVAIWAISTYNRFVGMRTRVEEAFSTIDVFLKKRYDLIPNVVETVKGYAGHEKETLEAVISARNKAVSSTPEERGEAEGELTNALSRLLMLSEAYPDLKANTNFMELQKQLGTLESEIEKARRYYNGIAAQMNTAIQQFPSNIIASRFGFIQAPFFEAEETHRENVKVEF
ncbi:MAG: LemA family protein [Clostridiales bacterium]|nr:LemA family protein [Clostridiales bacterium]